MVYRISAIVFFLSFGIGFFIHGLGIVSAIAAIIAGIALIANM